MGNSAIVTFEGLNHVNYSKILVVALKLFVKEHGKKVKHYLTKKNLILFFVAVAKAELKAPKIKKVNGGTDLRIKCKVTNRVLPHPAIAWYKDGALLTHDTVEIETKK